MELRISIYDLERLYEVSGASSEEISERVDIVIVPDSSQARYSEEEIDALIEMIFKIK